MRSIKKIIVSTVKPGISNRLGSSETQFKYRYKSVKSSQEDYSYKTPDTAYIYLF